MLKKLRNKIKIKQLKKKNISLNETVNFKNPEEYLNPYISVGARTNIRKSYIGSYTYIGTNCYLPSVKIGKYCSIGNNIKAMLMDHPVDLISTHPIFYKKGNDTQVGRTLFSENKDVNLKKGVSDTVKIEIGNDVWIGDNVVIMPGVTVGDGAIIGTGAIVTKNVPAYGVAVGVPAVVKKYRFVQSEIEKLLKIKWWDKDFNWITNNKELFHNPKDFFKSID